MTIAEHGPFYAVTTSGGGAITVHLDEEGELRFRIGDVLTRPSQGLVLAISVGEDRLIFERNSAGKPEGAAFFRASNIKECLNPASAAQLGEFEARIRDSIARQRGETP